MDDALAASSFSDDALAAAAFRTCGDRKEAGEDAALEQAIEDRAQNRLVEWTQVEQEGQHRKEWE